jgi:hypothetical protein
VFSYVIKFTMMSLPLVKATGYQIVLELFHLLSVAARGDTSYMIWFQENKLANNIMYLR